MKRRRAEEWFYPAPSEIGANISDKFRWLHPNLDIILARKGPLWVPIETRQPISNPDWKSIRLPLKEPQLSGAPNVRFARLPRSLGWDLNEDLIYPSVKVEEKLIGSCPVCATCRHSLICLQGIEKSPMICQKCRVEIRAPHEMIRMLETKSDDAEETDEIPFNEEHPGYAHEGNKVSAACPSFWLSHVYCAHCEKVVEGRNEKKEK